MASKGTVSNTCKALPSGFTIREKQETSGPTVKCGKWQIEGEKQNQHPQVICLRPVPQAKKKKKEKTCSLVKNQLTNQHCMVSGGLRSTCFVTFTFHYSSAGSPLYRCGSAVSTAPGSCPTAPPVSALHSGLLVHGLLGFQPSAPSLHSHFPFCTF